METYFQQFDLQYQSSDLGDMTLQALERPETSRAFAFWLKKRNDIFLGSSIRIFEEMGLIKTSQYLKYLPLDGRHNPDSFSIGWGLDEV